MKELLLAVIAVFAISVLFVAPGTNHVFASNGTSSHIPSIPPTIGVDYDNWKRVENGFTYNKKTVDVGQYYTHMEKVQTKVGQKNVAIIKVWDNRGLDNISHVGLAFGLGPNQHFSQSVAQIDYDLKNNESTYSQEYFSNVNIFSNVVSCGENVRADKCRQITIEHWFKKAPEFDLVAVNTWNHQRAYWQFVLNDGVDIIGEPQKVVLTKQAKPSPQLSDKDHRYNKDFKTKMQYEADRALTKYLVKNPHF